MHLRSDKAFGIILAIGGMCILFLAVSTIIGSTSRWHPRAVKPAGLAAMETSETRDLQSVLENVYSWMGGPEIVQTPPVDPQAPEPAETKLYNNILDNLLSSLHFYYRVPDDAPDSEYVIAWDPQTGGRTLSDVRLFALESNVNYLLSLETYRQIHTKAVFDDDLRFARKRVEAVFSEDWHTSTEWPIGPYFDLVQLNELTGDARYLEWADRYAAGDGRQDRNTPLGKSIGLAFQYGNEMPRQASPFFFLNAALLADWGKRNDPTLNNQARTLFVGLRDMLYDQRYNMLWKQSSVQAAGSNSVNLIQTFDTMEQLTAIRAMLYYAEASNDSEGVSLARAVMDGVWETGSPLLMQAPAPLPETTFFGLYTAYDVDREAKRQEPAEMTMVQVFLFETNVRLNEMTRGEYRGDVDFLTSWIQESGPLYREYVNGYYTSYNQDWKDPDMPLISAKAAIWVSRALSEDEWYKFKTAQLISSGDESESE